MLSSVIQPIPRTCREALTVLGLCAMLGTACAYSRMGEAEVRLQDGQPCFTLSAKEAKRGATVRLQALVISDLSSKPVTDVWSMSLDPMRSAPLSPASCMAYGQIPTGAEAEPAPELKTGRVYEVFLNGRRSDPSDPTQGYIAKFCLVADEAGGRRLMPVEFGSRAWTEGVCR